MALDRGQSRLHAMSRAFRGAVYAAAALAVSMTLACVSGPNTSAVDPAALIRGLPSGSPLLVWDGLLLSGFTLRPEDVSIFRVRSATPVDRAAALRRWGERVREGAIIIETSGSPRSLELRARFEQIDRLLEHFSQRDTAPPAMFIGTQRGRTQALFVIHDSIVPREAAERIYAGFVADTIDVLRGQKAAELYGSRAWYGVVVIR